MSIAENLPELLKVLISGSIFFVWVIRYSNIVQEFSEFGYPNWLRDFVGVLKISFAIMLLKEDFHLIKIASAGVALLMLAALATHLKVKNPLHKMLPSFTLLCLGSYLLLNS